MNINYNQSDIDKARNINLVDYLQSKGYQANQKGNYYRFEISGHTIEVNINKPSLYTRWSVHESGNSIQLLQKYLGYTFQGAISELLGGNYVESIPSDIVQPKEPPSAEELSKEMDINIHNIKKSYAYLIKTRCLNADIVKALVNNNLMSTDNHYNMVFYHYDIKSLEVVGYSKRGTNTFKVFKNESHNSTSFFMLNTFNGNIEPLTDISKIHIDIFIVCESCIDTISFYELYRHKWSGKRVILLSLSSTSSMNRFCPWYKDNNINADSLLICTDNDQSGLDTLKVAKNSNLKFKAWYGDLRTHGVKDYNELLQKLKKKQ